MKKKRRKKTNLLTCVGGVGSLIAAYATTNTKKILNLKNTKNMKTYDVHFNDNYDSNSKDFEMTIEDAKAYITSNNGTNNSYFADYKGGIVSIVCNQNGETVYEEEIR